MTNKTVQVKMEMLLPHVEVQKVRVILDRVLPDHLMPDDTAPPEEALCVLLHMAIERTFSGMLEVAEMVESGAATEADLDRIKQRLA